jgi:hypothetical protein
MWLSLRAEAYFRSCALSNLAYMKIVALLENIGEVSPAAQIGGTI